MNETHADARQCPTRRDGRAALFTHRVTEPECQSRQRGMFHRCFTCAYNNAWVAKNGPPRGTSAAPDAATEGAVPAPAALEDGPPDGEPLAGSEALAVLRVAR